MAQEPPAQATSLDFVCLYWCSAAAWVSACHAESYCLHSAACKNTSARYMRGIEAPRGYGPRFLVRGSLP